MTSLLDLVQRALPPSPWAEGDNIPWNEPEFSKRMLACHLDQQHDLASRRFEIIDRHVAWIHRVVLEGRPNRVLDLTCGPGLYTHRLARLGHECVGVDFSPASIAHAKDVAAQEGLPCTYLEKDVRSLNALDVGTEFGLVMMLWGQINVFRRSVAKQLLSSARDALKCGGRFLLEPQTFEHLERSGRAAPGWRTESSGLFSDRPHVILDEAFWDESSSTSTHRFFIIDAESGDVTRYALSNEAYTREQFQSLLLKTGYRDARFFPSLTGEVDDSSGTTLALVAET
jgi:SAM-dependent methyltransferase